MMVSRFFTNALIACVLLLSATSTTAFSVSGTTPSVAHSRSKLFLHPDQASDLAAFAKDHFCGSVSEDFGGGSSKRTSAASAMAAGSSTSVSTGSSSARNSFKAVSSEDTQQIIPLHSNKSGPFTWCRKVFTTAVGFNRKRTSGGPC